MIGVGLAERSGLIGALIRKIVLVAPRPATAVYSHMLHHYRRLAGTAAFRAKLGACADEAAVWQLMREHEWNRESAAQRALLTQRLRGRAASAGKS